MPKFIADFDRVKKKPKLKQTGASLYFSQSEAIVGDINVIFILYL